MTEAKNWQAINQEYLMAILDHVRYAIAIEAGESVDPPSPLPSIDPNARLPAIEELCRIFGLSLFEKEVLILCAGMELDLDFITLCAKANGQDPQKAHPTFNLALRIFEAPHWNGLIPSAPLRRWRLIDLGGGGVLTHSPLRIDERILHYLAGIQNLDERLLDIVELIPPPIDLVYSHQMIANQIVDTWDKLVGVANLPVIQLCGEDVTSKQAIAARSCQKLGLNLYSMGVDTLPTTISELNHLMRLWEREAILSSCGLLLDCNDLEASEKSSALIARIVEKSNCPLIISTRDRLKERHRPLINFDIYKPTIEEQRHLWKQALGDFNPNFKNQLEQFIAQFNLSSTAIAGVSSAVKGVINDEQIDESQFKQVLWDACRSQARPRLDDLAQRIEPTTTWEDLILPESQTMTLKTIVAHVRQRAKVYEDWGFAGKSGRGLGISALFAGPSGTGKTTAAEVIALDLRLDLYRIDLSSVISKYIGETEKNLRRVFDAAESGGAILLFDEADALFGKRSDVKDSHDRHANIEVSYLLQRMEAYRGLAILTTNLKSSLDTAFLRRIRFVVQFPFPDAEQRSQIWQRIFPKQTPTQGLDPNKLGKLSVSGGNIRNIAVNATFLAADSGEPVMMKHILIAAKSEHTKLEKPLIENEVKGWV